MITELAKCCLWMVSVTLFGVFIGSVYVALRGDHGVIGHIISSAQVLSFIAVTVIGHHVTDKQFTLWRHRNMQTTVQEEPSEQDANT